MEALLQSPAEGVQKIVLRDKAGNETSVHITVNGTHTFEMVFAFTVVHLILIMCQNLQKIQIFLISRSQH